MKVPALVLGSALAVAAAAGGLLYGEHAAVRLTVTPQPVQVENVTLTGGASDLRTTPLVASVTESRQVASSEVLVPATVATGRVTFMCSPMSLCPNGYSVPAGTVLGSTRGAEYRTLSAVSFPSCAPSLPVAISALTPGATGNAGAGTVVYGPLPSYIHVTNPWPVAGGADARTVPTVERSDVDTAVSALTAAVTSELPAKLQAVAGGLSYVAAGAPSFTVGGDFRVGAHTPAFTVTVTANQQALGFFGGAGRDLLRQALSRHVPAGYHLASDRLDATYSAAGATITGSADGYMIPDVDIRHLEASLRGQSLSSAEDALRRASAGGAAKIQITPVAMPWLPMMAGNISVQVVVQLK